ncbi:MAG: prolyl oligopeptidase family serine peptidase [bacterium]
MLKQIQRFSILPAFMLALFLFACSSGGSPDSSDSSNNLPKLTPAGKVNVQATALPPLTAVAQNSVNLNKQKVTFKDKDGLTLVGYVYKPDGDGPFPTLIWNHGSEENAGQGDNFDLLPVPFVSAGYAFFAPVRRGQGESQGKYIMDVLGDIADNQDRHDKMVELMSTEQLQDQMAGFDYAKSLPFVDKDRMAVMGCSFGGIETILGAEKDNNKGYKAAIALSPGAESWEGSPPLRKMLKEAVTNIKIPIMILHPAKDVSLKPGYVLGEQMQDNNQVYALKIFPALGDENGWKHCFGGGTGTKIWSNEALHFLEKIFPAN